MAAAKTTAVRCSSHRSALQAEADRRAEREAEALFADPPDPRKAVRLAAVLVALAGLLIALALVLI
jgi:hypothetical protein